jgi:enamine deaminase RidA (YjgF/YER057c/UK114 family)
MPHRLVEPGSFPWLDTSAYTFSPGVEAAGATWVSGQTAAEHDATAGRVVVRGDGGEQAALCWQKVQAVLEGAGRSPADCTEAVEYLTPAGLAERDAVAAARPDGLSAIAGAAPSTVVVESLVRPTALVEVEVVAGRPAGVVKLPQVLPVDAAGDVVAPGDLVGQAEWVLEEAGRRLEAHGLGLGHVVRTVEQTTAATRSQYRATAEARRRLLGPAFPASTGVLSPALPHPEALIALDMWASREPKRVIAPTGDAFSAFTFSPAVEAGRLLFVSGTTAWDPASGELVGPGDVAAQAEHVYGQIARICEAAGGSIADLVKTVEYVSTEGMARYREVGAVRERVLGRPYPVSTGVVVAGLLNPAWLIEVDAVAVLP